MAYTIENNYTGNGTTTLYSFTFPYLETTDIKVSVNQVDQTLTTHYTIASPTQISFVSAPTNGQAIRIYRDTDISALQSEFFSGSAIRAQDLNNDFNQTLYVSQETEKAVEGKWNDTTQTLDSSEAFVDSNDYIMTAAAIDDRIIAKQAARALADGKIIVGNGSGVGAEVTPSGDVTMSNTGAFTIANTSVENGMIANDAINGAKLADDAVDSEHLSNGCIDTVHIADSQVTSTKIGSGQVNAGHLATNAVEATHILASNVTTAKLADANVTLAKVENVTDGQIIVGNGSNRPTAVAVSGDVTLANSGAVTIATGAVEHAMLAGDCVDGDNIADNAVGTEHIADAELTTLAGMQSGTASVLADSTALAATTSEINSVCENRAAETTITDDDSKIPTSGAVVDYVAAQLAPIGGLEVIADDESFPNTIPSAGVVISISDAAGLQINSSGVSTNADTLDNSTVTINGFPSELRGGVNGNADPYVLAAGTGLMVQSTGSSQTYNYHQVMIREADFVQLSDDINDFNSRYRTAGSRTADGDASNDEGDLFFDQGTNKMYVHDGSTWGEVTSTGQFKYLFLCPAGGTGAPTLDGNIATYDLREVSNSGAVASVTNAAQLIVSINGVVQKANTGTSAPAEGFALVDANTIIFGANLENGDSVFIVQIGAAVSIPTPGDDTVSTVKIQNLAVTTGKIADQAVALTKLPHGDGSSNGKFLRSNNGADPTWETVSTTPEGTAILSTGESGASKFLREDGDGSCSWQSVIGAVADGCIYENDLTISNDHTIAATKGAHSVGPITVNATVTVNGNWVIS